MLCGATYTRRLWCVLEVFTFLRMGASINDITVIPLLHENEGDSTEDGLLGSNDHALRQFATFDVKHAECRSPSDTARLLAVIETGFGDHATFNALVRSTFVRQMTLKRQSVRSSLTPMAPATHAINNAGPHDGSRPPLALEV